MNFENKQGYTDLNRGMQQSKCCALPLGDSPINRHKRDHQLMPIANSQLYTFSFDSPYPQCLIVLWVYFSKLYFILLADMALYGLHALSELHCTKTLTYNRISLKPLHWISRLRQSVPRVEKQLT